MRKTVRMMLLIIAMGFQSGVMSQDFKDYYKLIEQAQYCSAKNKDLKGALDCYQKAFKIKINVNPFDYMAAADVSARLGERKLFTEYLLNAAKTGVDIENINDEWSSADSLMTKMNLKERCKRIYDKNMLKGMMVTNEIENINFKDQYVRRFNSLFADDSCSLKLRVKVFLEVDSSNFFRLWEIIHAPDFDLNNITADARTHVIVILTHSLSDDFTINKRDSIISWLKKEMQKGNLNNKLYAMIIDRFYLHVYEKNYYYQFPYTAYSAFEIEGIDKRREEIGLGSLYERFKKINKLKELPEGYKYDAGVVK